MTIKRGEVWLASLDPAQGSEQAGKYLHKINCIFYY